MKSFREFLNEKAPPGKKAEDWIKKNKQRFKDEYGEDWEKVLYAKAWKLFGESSIEEVDIGFEEYLFEDSAAPTTMTAGVANPDPKPLFKKSKFLGCECIEVDPDTYSATVQGKKPFDRWNKYIKDDALKAEMRKMYKRNKRMLVQNSASGAMAYIK